jgi:N-acetylglucosamine-6-phosphate deacetylase
LAARIEGDDPGARMTGIHLEGPFLSHSKRGVHPPACLLAPSIQVFDRFWQAARGHIRLMTIAPELPGACELIAHAAGLGVRVSMGHSNSGARQARDAMAAGACSATHTFNAMGQLGHRDPGLLGVVLTSDELFAEIICDGIHVDPAAVKLFWKAKGRERTLLMTDAMSAAGMPDGVYMLGGLRVEVSNGKCVHDGVLAGSVLTMDRAVRNLVSFTGALLSDAVASATRNPARMTGLEASIGSLACGRRADIVVLSATGEVAATVIGGRFAHRASEVTKGSIDCSQ